MTQQEQEERMKFGHQFRSPKREWMELSPQLFVERRVAEIVSPDSVRQEVGKLTEGYQSPITRIEVVTYQGGWDENIHSVGIALETDSGAFYHLFSFDQDQVERLVPFRGLVAI